MRIEVKDLTIQNFLPFGNVPQKITFNAGINLIKGTVVGRDSSNGSGKSAILDAFSWVLYGKVPRDVNQNDLINWKNRKDCKIETNFVKGDNSYKVIRGLKPNFLEIYENGSLLPSSGKRDYQDFISWDIVGLHYNTFINLVYSNLNSSIAILKMTKPQKRYFIEKLFNLEIFTRLNENCKNKLKNIDFRIAELQSLSRTYLEQINEAQKEEDVTQLKLDDLKSSASKLIQLKQTLEGSREQHWIKERDKFERYVKTLGEKKRKVKETYFALKNKISSIERTIQVLSSIVAEKSLSKMEALGEKDICPLCRQKIVSKKAINDVKEEIERQRKNTERVATYIKVLDSRLKPLFLDYEKRLSYSEEDLVTAEKALEVCNTELEKILKLEQQISIIESVMEHEKALKAEFVETIGRNNDKIVKLEKKLEKFKKEIEQLNSLKDYLSYIKESCKDEKIKHYAISSTIPYLNKNTNAYLAEVGFSFYLEIDKFIDAKVKGPGIYGSSYSSLSSGEGRSIDIAFQMALHDVVRIKAANFVDVLFCDEILDSSIDSSNISKIFNIIKNKQIRDNLKVYIITHRNEIEDLEFDAIHNVVKSGGFSKIL